MDTLPSAESPSGEQPAQDPEQGSSPAEETSQPVTFSFQTIPEYAAAHGISPATVRRRIKAGEIAADLHPGPRGPEYRIHTLPTAAQFEESLHNWDQLRPVEHPTPPAEPASANPNLSNGQATLRSEQPTQREVDSLRTQLIRLGTGAAAAVSHWRKARRSAQEAQQRAQRLEADLSALRREVEALQARDQERAAEVEFLRARLVESEKGAEQLRVLVQSSQRALEAEQARTQALETERRQALPADTETQAGRRPWWQRWR